MADRKLARWLQRHYPAEWERVGGLSVPSKMPGLGYSIPAEYCRLGALLRRSPGTTCSKCYALKGRYVMANVREAMERRYQSLSSPTWVDDMTTLLNAAAKHTGRVFWFRWHDSGDVQDATHLANIAAVCWKTPRVRHWIPTREYWIAGPGHELPRNTVVRYSAHRIDAPGPIALAGLPVCSSTVVTSGATCPAPQQGNSCMDCRRCWDKRTRTVSYALH